MESLQNTRKHRENPENYTEIAVKYINTINTSETKLTCKYTTENKMTKKKKNFHYTFNKHENERPIWCTEGTKDIHQVHPLSSLFVCPIIQCVKNP